MSNFKEEFKRQFLGTTSNESAIIETPSPVNEDDVLEIHELRELAEPAPSLEEELKEAEELRCSLLNTTNQLKTVCALTPAFIQPAVTVFNEQLQDTAKVLGVDAPVALTLDQNTMQIDSESMESVLDWLGRGFKAFGSALVKMKNRFVIGFHRWGNLSIALKRRVNKAQSLLPRRKHPEGGNPITIKTVYGARLVKGEGLAVDVLAELNMYAALLEKATSIYMPVLEAIQSNISQTFTSIMAYNGHWNGIPLVVDTTAAIAELNALVKENKLYMGNYELQTLASKTVLPQLKLVPTRPSGEFIFKTIGGLVSLSNDVIRAQLISILRLIEVSMQSVEQTSDKIDDVISNLINAIGRINVVDNYRPIGTDGSAVGNIVAAAGTSMKLFNAMDLNRLEARIESEMGDIYTILDEMYVVYYDAVSAVLAHIEESLMQD